MSIIPEPTVTMPSPELLDQWQKHYNGRLKVIRNPEIQHKTTRHRAVQELIHDAVAVAEEWSDDDLPWEVIACIDDEEWPTDFCFDLLMPVGESCWLPLEVILQEWIVDG